MASNETANKAGTSPLNTGGFLILLVGCVLLLSITGCSKQKKPNSANPSRPSTVSREPEPQEPPKPTPARQEPPKPTPARPVTADNLVYKSKSLKEWMAELSSANADTQARAVEALSKLGAFMVRTDDHSVGVLSKEERELARTAAAPAIQQLVTVCLDGKESLRAKAGKVLLDWGQMEQIPVPVLLHFLREVLDDVQNIPRGYIGMHLDELAFLHRRLCMILPALASKGESGRIAAPALKGYLEDLGKSDCGSGPRATLLQVYSRGISLPDWDLMRREWGESDGREAGIDELLDRRASDPPATVSAQEWKRVRELCSSIRPYPLVTLRLMKDLAKTLPKLSPVSVDDFKKALQSPDPLVQSLAAEWLLDLGPKAAEAVPELRRLLDGKDSRRLHAAIALLISTQRADPAGLRSLSDALKTTPVPRRRLPEIVRLLTGIIREEKDSAPRALAVRTLGDIGPQVAAIDRLAVDRLRALLNDPSVELRKAAEEALLKIKSDR